MSLLAQKRRRRPELNLVPLIDVLVMLIFFAFVTMQFKSMATLNITLPKAETAGKNEFRGQITIAIDKDGKMSFNGKLIADDQLDGLLDEVHNRDRDTPVLIEGDQDSQLKKLVNIMDKCRRVGLNKIVLQTQ